MKRRKRLIRHDENDEKHGHVASVRREFFARCFGIWMALGREQIEFTRYHFCSSCMLA